MMCTCHQHIRFEDIRTQLGVGVSGSFLLLWVPGPNSGIWACRVTILPVHAFSDIYLFVQKVAIKMG